ncbi:MAG TPA: flagellar motor protein MotA [Kiloniellales bacterium]|nr:flagellar motor protein MotA [Kiloniellales bacterium]
MTQPSRYLVRMLLFIALVAAVCAMLARGLLDAFLVSPFLNGVILGVLLLGVFHIFRQVLLLRPEVAWLSRLQHETRDRFYFPDSMARLPPPRLLGPMATMLGERRGRLSLSALSMRTLMDGIQNRIDESHDLSRYVVGLLIFLGLLGTFWGLSQTVGAVGETISGLAVEGGDASLMFDRLKAGLEKPLSGMGTAFTSSLFGLASSLVVGFLELQSSQAHNRFMQDLEEWLSGVTRLSSGAIGGGEGEGASVPAYIQALLEQSADSLDALQRTISQTAEERTAVSRNLSLLNDRLGTLAAQAQAQQSVLANLAEATQQLRSVLVGNQGGLDESSRNNLRTIAIYAERLTHDLEQNRGELVQEMRNEIRLLARTIAALAGENR